jgi:hypothetical protein
MARFGERVPGRAAEHVAAFYAANTGHDVDVN